MNAKTTTKRLQYRYNAVTFFGKTVTITKGNEDRGSPGTTGRLPRLAFVLLAMTYLM